VASADQRPGLLIAFGMGATLLLHGALIGLLLGGRASASHVAPAQQFGQVVDVQAVKFGKPRDMRFLPHKEAPPAPRPQARLSLTDNEHALPHLKTPDELPRLADDPDRKLPHLDNPNASPESTGSVVEEGDPNGLRGGTATVGKGPVYLQHLVAAVQNAWIAPTSITDAQMLRLKAQACIHVDDAGKVTAFAISLPSGNARFDASLLDALAALKQLDPPSDEKIAPGGPTVRDALRGDGVCLNFQKTQTAQNSKTGD
jgi:hypothetical protein